MSGPNVVTKDFRLGFSGEIPVLSHSNEQDGEVPRYVS